MPDINMREKWAALSQKPPVRTLLVAVGFALIALTPVVGPIPGPGGVIVFGAGLTLVLKYSGWAKRLYVRLKRKHPKKGAWADWSLRRRSAQRRHALMKERELAEAAAAGLNGKSEVAGGDGAEQPDNGSGVPASPLPAPERADLRRLALEAEERALADRRR